ncbi:MAG: hypothetical protein KAI70_06425, partial [Candidatus Omnitrophica bacterium]|nr:hypothetical protein [Candidatus Omnitrophota bacterium]
MNSIRKCLFFKVVSLVVIMAFIAFDVSWAYPDISSEKLNYTLGIRGVMFQNIGPGGQPLVEIDQTGPALRASVLDLIDYFFESEKSKSLPEGMIRSTSVLENLPLRKGSDDTTSDGISYGHIGFDEEAGVLTIPYTENGKCYHIVISPKDTKQTEDPVWGVLDGIEGYGLQVFQIMESGERKKIIHDFFFAPDKKVIQAKQQTGILESSESEDESPPHKQKKESFRNKLAQKLTIITIFLTGALLASIFYISLKSMPDLLKGAEELSPTELGEKGQFLAVDAGGRTILKKPEILKEFSMHTSSERSRYIQCLKKQPALGLEWYRGHSSDFTDFGGAVKEFRLDTETGKWIIKLGFRKDRTKDPHQLERIGSLLYDFGAGQYQPGNKIKIPVTLKKGFYGNYIRIQFVELNDDGTLTLVQGKNTFSSVWTMPREKDETIEYSLIIPQGVDMSKLHLKISFDLFNHTVDGEVVEIAPVVVDQNKPAKIDKETKTARTGQLVVLCLKKQPAFESEWYKQHSADFTNFGGAVKEFRLDPETGKWIIRLGFRNDETKDPHQLE